MIWPAIILIACWLTDTTASNHKQCKVVKLSLSKHQRPASGSHCQPASLSSCQPVGQCGLQRFQPGGRLSIWFNWPPIRCMYVACSEVRPQCLVIAYVLMLLLLCVCVRVCVAPFARYKQLKCNHLPSVISANM